MFNNLKIYHKFFINFFQCLAHYKQYNISKASQRNISFQKVLIAFSYATTEMYLDDQTISPTLRSSLLQISAELSLEIPKDINNSKYQSIKAYDLCLKKRIAVRALINIIFA